MKSLTFQTDPTTLDQRPPQRRRETAKLDRWKDPEMLVHTGETQSLGTAIQEMGLSVEELEIAAEVALDRHRPQWEVDEAEELLAALKIHVVR